MFGDRQARTRSYSAIEEEAVYARQCGRISAHGNFDIVGFILGALALRMKPKLKINIYEDGEHSVPAFVSFAKGHGDLRLNISNKVWQDAKSDLPQARYILAHEIGHILMHSHDELAFSSSIPSLIEGLQPEDRTEPQANLFADLFLVSEIMLEGFSHAEDVADYFNVPLDCAKRRLDHANDTKRRKLKADYTGEFCQSCANFTLVRTKNGLACHTCGSTKTHL